MPTSLRTSSEIGRAVSPSRSAGSAIRRLKTGNSACLKHSGEKYTFPAWTTATPSTGPTRHGVIGCGQSDERLSYVAGIGVHPGLGRLGRVVDRGGGLERADRAPGADCGGLALSPADPRGRAPAQPPGLAFPACRPALACRICRRLRPGRCRDHRIRLHLVGAAAAGPALVG